MFESDPLRVKFRARLKLVGGFLFLYFAFLLLKAFSLHVTDRNELEEKISKKFSRVFTVSVPLYRGSIKDSQGRDLALSVPTLSLYAHPSVKHIKRRKEFVKGLSRITKIPEKEIERRLSAGEKVGKSYTFLRGISLSLREDLRKLIVDTENASVIGIQQEYRRFYPYRYTASNLIGFVGNEGRGLEGMEYKFDNLLGGGIQRLFVYAGAGLGKVFLEPLKGRLGTQKDVFLTLDLGVQNIAEGIKHEIVRKWKPKKVSIVLMDLKNGNIVALANYPSYDPNNYRKFPPERRKNHAVTDVFEPGSIMKPFFIAYALEKNKVAPYTRVDTGRGRIKVGKKFVRDLKPRGKLKLKDVLVYSSNVGTILVARQLDQQEVKDLLYRFHLNEKFYVFPGEAKPQIPDLKFPANIDYMSIGQGIALSAVHITASFGALATGRVLKPRIVLKAQDMTGREESLSQVEVLRDKVLSNKTLNWIRNALIEVVERGTGRKARSKYFYIAGKTGTSQKFDVKEGKYSREKVVTYFAGFFPATDPRFVGVIVVDEPKGRNLYGGEVAAPYFRKLAEKVAFYYGLKPDKIE